MIVECCFFDWQALEELTTEDSPVRHGEKPSPTASAALRIVVDSITHCCLESPQMMKKALPRILAGMQQASALMAMCLPGLEFLHAVHGKLQDCASSEVIRLIMRLLQTLNGAAPRSVLFYAHQVLLRWFLSLSLEVRSHLLESVCEDLREIRPMKEKHAWQMPGAVGGGSVEEIAEAYRADAELSEGTIDQLLRCASSKVLLGSMHREGLHLSERPAFKNSVEKTWVAGSVIVSVRVGLHGHAIITLRRCSGDTTWLVSDDFC